MDEKELNKKLRSEVKPGTESIAIGEAQSQANQLLTEQRMNLESEKQVVSSNSSRDTELRGAIELGVSNSPQIPQQALLPPESANLRPETRNLLANYGINPQITESSRSNSNSTQSRSSNISRQSTRSGDTKVTNTTNITNITNNNTRNETNVDIDNPKSGNYPRAVTSISSSQDNIGKFRIFMSNLFSKRDQEKRNQEKEFRKRDWSLKRMTDKIMNRMDSISDSFAKRMNPQNIGRTFSSQIKLLLGALGLTLLPKLWTKLISGIDSIGNWISDIKAVFDGTSGGFFDKLGATIGSIGKSIVGSIVGGFKAIMDNLDIKLARMLAGPSYNESTKKGVFQVAAEKLASYLSNGKPVDFDKDDWKGQFGDSMKEYFSELKDDLKSILNSMMEDRAEAVHKASSKISGWDVFKPAEAIGKLVDIIGAAIGGNAYLASSSMSKAESQSSEDLRKGEKKNDFSFWGDIESEHGTLVVSKNLGKAARDKDNSNSVTISKGLKDLYEYGSDKETSGILMRRSDMNSIISRTSNNENDKARMTKAIDYAVKVGAIKIIQDDTYVQTGDPLYRVVPEAVPTFIGILSNLPGIPMEFKMESIPLNNSIMKEFYSDKDVYREYVERLDENIVNTKLEGSINTGKLINPLHWLNEGAKSLYNDLSLNGLLWDKAEHDFDFYKTKEDKSSLRQFGYTSNKEASDRYKKMLNDRLEKFKTDTVVLNDLGEAVDNAKKKIKDASNVTIETAKGFGQNAVASFSEGYNDQVSSAYESTDRFLNEDASDSFTKLKSKSLSLVNKVKNYVWDNDEESSELHTDKVEIRIPEKTSTNLTESKKVDEVKVNNEETSSDLNDNDKKSNKVSISSIKSVKSTPEYIVDWLVKNLNLTEDQAVGVVGVMNVESRLDPSAVNKMAVKNGDKYPDNGLCQWQGKYRNEMFKSWVESKYGSQNGKTMPYQFDTNTQLEFLKHDLETNRPRTLESLRSSSTIEEAVDVFLRGYENGGNGLVSIPKLNSEYNRLSSWWRNNTLSTGQQPYDRMYSDRLDSAKYIYSEITNSEYVPSSSQVDHKEDKNSSIGEVSSITSDDKEVSSSYSKDRDSSSGSFISSAVSNIIDKMISTADKMFSDDDISPEVNSNVIPPEISKYSSSNPDSSINPDGFSLENAPESSIEISKSLTPNKIDYEQVSDYIDAKESEASKEEEIPSINNINTGGNTSISNSGNTTIINYKIDDSKNSFFEVRQRINNR